MSTELASNALERRPHEYYSPERKAEVLSLLDANDGNIKRTANESGIHHATLQYWQANKERYAELQPQKLIDLAQMAENNARILAQSIQEHDLTEAPLGQKATAFGIMVDKMQLLRNQPTSIVEHTDSGNLTIILQNVLNEITSTESTD